MNYEKAYKAVLQTAKQWIKDGCTDKERICLECVFPELRESEEERIRKELIQYLKDYPCNLPNGLYSRYDFFTYLEKQKEQKTDAKSERVIKAARRVLNNWLDGTDCPDVSGDFTELEYAIREYDGEEKQKEPHYTKRNALFDKCVENCDPKTVEEVNKRVDDIMNMPELSAFEQALTNFIGYWEDDEEHWPSKFVKKHGKHILDMAREELQKEQKPNIELIQRSWYMEGYHDREFGKEPKWIIKTGEGGPKHELNPRYGQPLTEEPKPVEKQDYSGLNDLERAIHRGFLCAGVENIPVTIIKETAQECLARMKPAEWSEEDKRKLNRIYEILGYAADDKGFLTSKRIIGDKEAIELQDFLKSLRPSWKPSDQ